MEVYKLKEIGYFKYLSLQRTLVSRAQKRFQDFLEEWKAEGSDELKYLNDARELNEHSRNTLQV